MPRPVRAPALAILCATRGEEALWPFLRQMLVMAAQCRGICTFLADGTAAVERLRALPSTATVIPVDPALGVHRTMQAIVAACPSDYVLFLDDDETCAPALVRWLAAGGYRTSDLWRINRAWLWPTAQSYIVDSPHWPDVQIRLGRRTRVQVPTRIHQGWIARFQCPAVAPSALLHHKLIVRSRAEREAAVAQYEQIRPGAGHPDYYVPDDHTPRVAAWHD